MVQYKEVNLAGGFALPDFSSESSLSCANSAITKTVIGENDENAVQELVLDTANGKVSPTNQALNENYKFRIKLTGCS